MDARAAGRLVEIVFSQNASERAKAKLDLRATQSQYTEIISRAGYVLDLVCAEAKLTPLEVMHFVFPRRSQHHTCLACNKAVIPGSQMFHTKCITRRWLISHSGFAYSEEESLIYELQQAYISKESRANVVLVWDTLAQFQRPIVKTTRTTTDIWERQEDGSLRKMNVWSQNEGDIVGSLEWRRAHGISKSL